MFAAGRRVGVGQRNFEAREQRRDVVATEEAVGGVETWRGSGVASLQLCMRM